MAKDELTMLAARDTISPKGRVALSPVDNSKIKLAFLEAFQMEVPEWLLDFYELGVELIGDLTFIIPGRSARFPDRMLMEAWIDEFRTLKICPIASDGSGNYYGVYLIDENCGCVYFFDSSDLLSVPSWCAASSLARFLIVANAAAENDGEWPSDVAQAEVLDPFLGRCVKAPPVWQG